MSCVKCADRITKEIKCEDCGYVEENIISSDEELKTIKDLSIFKEDMKTKLLKKNRRWERWLLQLFT